MDNRFRMRISRIFRFRGSFGLCQTAGDLPDVVEKPLLTPLPQQKQPEKDSYFRLTKDPKTIPFTSICQPKCPETTTKAITDSIFPRRKIPRPYPSFVSADSYPHNKHSSPLNPFYQNPKNPKNNNKNKNSFTRRNLSSSYSQDTAYFLEEDKESSKSTFSSDSAGYRREKRRSRRRRGNGVHIGGQNAVEESFAVVKRSRDPYNDFRRSMVEMIVEKQIFAAYDLEQLLQCFLFLNSGNHHRIIVDVFTDIYDVLFS